MNFQVLSKWMINHSGVIETGNDIVDSVFTVLLSTTILVGGVIGCLLDNIIPGTICTKIILSLVREFSIVSLYKTIKYFVCIYYYFLRYNFLRYPWGTWAHCLVKGNGITYRKGRQRRPRVYVQYFWFSIWNGCFTKVKLF